MTAVTDHDHTDHMDQLDRSDHLKRMDHMEQAEGHGGVDSGARGTRDVPAGRGPSPDQVPPTGTDVPAVSAASAAPAAPAASPAPDNAGTAVRADAGEGGPRPAEGGHARVPEERRDGERQARVPEANHGDQERHARVKPSEAETGGAGDGGGTGASAGRHGDGVTADDTGGDGTGGTAASGTNAGGSNIGGDKDGARSGSRGGSGPIPAAGSGSGSGSAPGSGSGTAAGPASGTATGAPSREGFSSDPDADLDPDSEAWDDGLIARRVTESNAAALAAERAALLDTPARGPSSHNPVPLAYDGPLRSRLDALRELVGLSRARLDSRTLAEAGRVLDEAAARRKLSGRHTVVAIAGATGSGKSQLFNALAGVAISETGVRRPTTASPIACSWSDGAAGLIDRLGIPGRLRRRPLHSAEGEGQLRGLVLVDLPDHDSAAVEHRAQVDRILRLVDAVIWVVDPEKYADAMLHERYLRPMAGHAEVMFVVLNQIDRLPGDAADQVLDDLRRLLDEDGVALGEFGEPGATVLALSALTGDGVGDLRDALGDFVTERGAAARRVAADVDSAADQLRPVYATGRRVGLSEEAREEFAARLADAVGATAAGEAAERAWLRNANRACGTPWLRLWRWYHGRGDSTTGRLPVRTQADEEATARQRVEQAVRTVSDRASAGLPAPWAQAVREAAVRGSQGLSEALDELAARAGLPPGRPPRPGWWPVAVLVQAAMTLLQIVGGAWLAGQIAGVMAPNLGVPVLLMVCGIIGGPLVEWGCRMAARGPARRYGQDAERRLREAAGSCGRARVLDPLAAELLRYREVREQYGRVVRTGAGVG
ncbi:GTPase [Streptomyces collinus]|uniref:GTPase n=1 Tax=Streptomyces collinus TaxID=42684 RepID=UPI0036AFE31E